MHDLWRPSSHWSMAMLSWQNWDAAVMLHWRFWWACALARRCKMDMLLMKRYLEWTNQMWCVHHLTMAGKVSVHLDGAAQMTHSSKSVMSHQHSRILSYYFWDKKQPYQGDWHDFTEERWNPFQGTHQSWVGILCLTILLFLFHPAEHFIMQSTSSSTTFNIYDIHLLTTFLQVRTSSRCPISIMFEGT